MSERDHNGCNTTHIRSINLGQASIKAVGKGDLGQKDAALKSSSETEELIKFLPSVAGNMLEPSTSAPEPPVPPPTAAATEHAGSGAAPGGDVPAPVIELSSAASASEPLPDAVLPDAQARLPPAAVAADADGGRQQEPSVVPEVAPPDGLLPGGEDVTAVVARALAEEAAVQQEPATKAPAQPAEAPPVAPAEPAEAPVPPAGEPEPAAVPPAGGDDGEETIDIETDELPVEAEGPAALKLEAPEPEQEQQQQEEEEEQQEEEGRETMMTAAAVADAVVAAALAETAGLLQIGAEQPLAFAEGVAADGGGTEAGAEGAAAAGEAEDEDIDIEDVDEEEEAKIKEAMGVGLGTGEAAAAAEPYAGGGEFAANSGGAGGGAEAGGMLEVEGDEGADMDADGKLRAPRPRNKRKLAEDGSFLPGVVRRTRQRTARPAHKLKKRIVPGGAELPYLHVEPPEDEEEVAGEPPAAAAKLRRAKMASTTTGSPTEGVNRNPKARKPEEPLVRFSIKSFAVPELVVALPETASVAALKKAVMEAAMTLLGGGLRVRVLLQGKRMSDEATSLAQAGISRAALGGKTSDALAFMLEPSPLVPSPGTVDDDPLLVLSQAAGTSTPGVDLSGARPAFGLAARGARGAVAAARLKTRAVRGGPELAPPPYQLPEPQVNIYGEPIGKGRLGGGGARGAPKPASPAVPSPHTTRVAAAQALAAIRSQAQEQAKEEPLTAGSGAIVLHQSAYEQGQSLALAHHKRAGGMQLMNMEGRRRIRRPFTVAEVGALVDAVEQLGTGRWRDVKMRAFSQAKHRTYVDLKDKWRALVRTAQIPPHQRRGEPIPQELLDRVVRAHAYWTEQLQLEMMEDES